MFIPDKLDNKHESIRELFSDFSDIDYEISSEDTLIFDFSKIRWIDAEMTTLLAMIFDYSTSKGVKVKANLKGMSPKVREILIKNKFLSHFSISESIDDIYDTTISFLKSDIRKQDVIDSYIYDELFNSINKKISSDLLNQIYENLWEIIHNVIDHSKSDKIYMCGQFYPRKPFDSDNGMISFAIGDVGVGLLNNIREKINIKDEKNAFEWAFGEGNTTKDIVDGGLGLFEIKDNLAGKGDITIITNSGYYNICQDSRANLEVFPFDVPGTLVIITLYLDKFLSIPKKNVIMSDEDNLLKDSDFLNLFI